MLARTLCVSLWLAATVRTQTLSLVNSFEGSTFFDNFNYNESVIDAANYGNVHYVSQEIATSSRNPLTFVNSAGNAIIKVDNMTSGVGDSTFGRNSVTLISKSSITFGSLVLIDALSVPYGCSVWPAMWMLGNTSTDESGEIDIFESVNLRTLNQMTLHTLPGCTQSNSTSLPWANSTVLSTNCDFEVDGNMGCAFMDTRDNSAGQNLSNNSGGVYAMLWDGDGIQTWFFPRPSVPSDITSGSPSPSSWSAPQAAWPAASCDPSTFFTEQNLILNINICGAFAGNSEVYSETCSGLCTDLVGDPSNYDTAYFELQSIKIYNGASTTVPQGSATIAAKSGASSLIDQAATLLNLAFITAIFFVIAGFI